MVYKELRYPNLDNDRYPNLNITDLVFSIGSINHPHIKVSGIFYDPKESCLYISACGKYLDEWASDIKAVISKAIPVNEKEWLRSGSSETLPSFESDYNKSADLSTCVRVDRKE